MKKSLLICYVIISILFIAMLAGMLISAVLGEEFDMLFQAPGILLFLGFWCYGFITQFKEKDYVPNMMRQVKTLKPALRIPLSIVCAICFVIMLASFVISSIYGGLAAYADGVYYIISHGKFIREITAEEYIVIRTFDRYTWFVIMIPIAINFLIYLKNKMNTPIEEIANEQELTEKGLLKNIPTSPRDKMKQLTSKRKNDK